MDNLLVSKSIAEQQLNNNSDHNDDIDKPLAVTKTDSCHVAMNESLQLFCFGSNSVSNGLVEQIFKEKKKESTHALDNSSSLASSPDSSDSGIDPSCISDDKTNEIADQLLTTKRSDGESNGLANVPESVDSARELETISISTSYGESSCVVDQSLALKRDIESSEMVNQAVNEILLANSDQDVAVVAVVHEKCPARSEIDIILNGNKNLFVEQPLTAGSVDDLYDSNSEERLPPFHGSDIDIEQPYVSDSDDSNSDEWVPPFNGSEIDSFYVSDDSYEGDYDSDVSYSDDEYEYFHHGNEEFELTEEVSQFQYIFHTLQARPFPKTYRFVLTYGNTRLKAIHLGTYMQVQEGVKKNVQFAWHH